MFARKFSPLFALGLIAAALVLAGCVNGLNLFTADAPFAKSFEVTSAPRIVVETFNGEIDVRAGSGGALEVSGVKRGSGATQADAEADLKNVDVSMTQAGDTLRIVARRTDNRFTTGNSGASFDLVVPAGATLELRTSNGAVETVGVTGDLTVDTSNGAIDVRGGAGRLDLRTSNGRIQIEAEKAFVNAGTSNGAIEFGGSLAEGDHVFDTSNGRIQLSLPADAQFRIDASTSNGKVSSDFAVAVTGSLDDEELHGTAGDRPSFSITATSSNGNIEIRKGK